MGTLLDRGIAWRRKFMFFPASQVQNMKNVAASDVFVQADGLAADVLTEITGTDYFAQLCTASGVLDTGSSFVVGPLAIPYDLDPAKNVGVGVVYTHDLTGTLTSATWAVTYSFINFGANVYNSAGAAVAAQAVTEPTTALDTVIAAQTNMTTNSLEILVSPRGIINASKLASTSGLWGFRARLSAASAVTDKIWALGILIDYDVRKTLGPGRLASTGVLQNYLDGSFQPNLTTP
jgi:hypothetical protein